MRKAILRAHQSCSVQKTAHKNTKYSTNESILKIGHLTKAIDFAKWSVWVKNGNGLKHGKKDSTRKLELFCAKKPLIKTPNIREMRAF